MTVRDTAVPITPQLRFRGALNLSVGAHASTGERLRLPTPCLTVASYFGILKRGIAGVYHHVSEEHLQRYVDEFDFRFSNRKSLGIDDNQCADLPLKGVVGKRLTYERAAQ